MPLNKQLKLKIHESLAAVLPVSNVLNHMFERLRQDVIADLVLQRCSFFLFLSLTRSDRGHSGGGSGDRAAESPPAVPGDSEADQGAGPRRAERMPRLYVNWLTCLELMMR